MAFAPTTLPEPAPHGVPPAHAATLVDHMEHLRVWCVIRTKDPDLADDVVQDTLLRALRQFPDLRCPERLRGWLFRIAQRRLADLLRRRPLELSLLEEPPAPAVAEAPPPEDKTKTAVRHAVKQLPTILRRPVRMHYWHNQPVRDVARHLGTTVGAVKSRLYRARRILRETAFE